MFEKNMLMKVFGYIFIAFWAVYLMMLGFMCYQMFDGGAIEAFDMVDGSMMLILVIDFFLRFGMQETPAQDIKPYKLLPIPIRFLLNVFLMRMGLRVYNFFWFFFLSQNSYLWGAPRLLSLPWSLSAFIPLLSPSVL